MEHSRFAANRFYSCYLISKLKQKKCRFNSNPWIFGVPFLDAAAMVEENALGALIQVDLLEQPLATFSRKVGGPLNERPTPRTVIPGASTLTVAYYVGAWFAPVGSSALFARNNQIVFTQPDAPVPAEGKRKHLVPGPIITLQAESMVDSHDNLLYFLPDSCSFLVVSARGYEVIPVPESHWLLRPDAHSGIPAHTRKKFWWKQYFDGQLNLSLIFVDPLTRKIAVARSDYLQDVDEACETLEVYTLLDGNRRLEFWELPRVFLRDSWFRVDFEARIVFAYLPFHGTIYLCPENRIGVLSVFARVDGGLLGLAIVPEFRRLILVDRCLEGLESSNSVIKVYDYSQKLLAARVLDFRPTDLSYDRINKCLLISNQDDVCAYSLSQIFPSLDCILVE